jgi:hypothetical protein
VLVERVVCRDSIPRDCGAVSRSCREVAGWGGRVWQEFKLWGAARASN